MKSIDNNNLPNKIQSIIQAYKENLGIKNYCSCYGIEYNNTDEFRNEVKNMIKERGAVNKDAVTIKANVLKKIRNIPNAYVGDIIWTNNPITPWNHVGVYTDAGRITEALNKGIKSRKTGWQNEYAFKIYKVMKQDKKDRYALSNRKSVAAWALKQVGKDYDVIFANNKQNTTASNKKFNCSELVWKSWRFNGKVSPDLDSNGGKGVYPNNIRDSSRTVKVTEG